jgi:hypothetical protein
MPLSFSFFAIDFQSRIIFSFDSAALEMLLLALCRQLLLAFFCRVSPDFADAVTRRLPLLAHAMRAPSLR